MAEPQRCSRIDRAPLHKAWLLIPWLTRCLLCTYELGAVDCGAAQLSIPCNTRKGSRRGRLQEYRTRAFHWRPPPHGPNRLNRDRFGNIPSRGVSLDAAQHSMLIALACKSSVTKPLTGPQLPWVHRHQSVWGCPIRAQCCRTTVLALGSL